MRKLPLLLCLLAASMVLYAVVFAHVERPLTLGDLTQQFAFKLAAAARTRSPKLVVFAGSNGRYSHRCSELSAATGLPCVNAAIASGIGIEFLLDQYTNILHRGDVVYMPLEYEQYSVSETEMHLGVQNAVMIRARPDYLWSLSPWRIAETLAAYDLPFLIRGSIEMGLDRAGFKRRTGLDTLTAEGDESGHTAAKGKPYQPYLRQAERPRSTVPEHSYAQDVIARFLRAAETKGIVVIGGLPTVPKDTSIDASDVSRIRALFKSAGQRFISTPGLSRYPIDCFFDVPYHLNEECQRQHSRDIGVLIKLQVAPLTGDQ